MNSKGTIPHSGDTAKRGNRVSFGGQSSTNPNRMIGCFLPASGFKNKTLGQKGSNYK